MEKDKVYDRPVCAVITLPDPDQMPVTHEVQTTGTIQWRTDTHQYSMFQVRFIGPNPEDEVSDKVLHGSDTAPVVLRLNKAGKRYEYEVSQFSSSGGQITSPVIAFRVQPCDGCHP